MVEPRPLGARAGSRAPAARRRRARGAGAGRRRAALRPERTQPALLGLARSSRPGVIDGLRMPADQGIAGWVARHRQALLLEDASQDPRWNRRFEAATRFRPRSMLCVPVISKNALHGVIQVMNRLDGRPFDTRQLRLVQILADHAAIAMENAALYRQAQLAAVTDDLTGLGNSRHLNQLLPQLIAEGRPLTLLVLDFDNFKQVVDRYGHLDRQPDAGVPRPADGAPAAPGRRRDRASAATSSRSSCPTAASTWAWRWPRPSARRSPRPQRLDDGDVDISGHHRQRRRRRLPRPRRGSQRAAARGRSGDVRGQADAQERRRRGGLGTLSVER